MTRIYLDACSIIYLVESSSPFHAVVTARLLPLRLDPEGRLLTSRLSRLECRTRPLAHGDAQILSAYDRFFARRRLILSEVTPAIIEQATDLRARYRFKTPDAIHLATAMVEHADRFLTGDADLVRCTEVAVDVLVP